MHQPAGLLARRKCRTTTNLVSTKQRWRDLIGYYTRYGDVRELLTQIDDRYVIVNSGDEMSLRFTEQPPPPAGWVRDYVIDRRRLDQGRRLTIRLFRKPCCRCRITPRISTHAARRARR